MSKVTEVLGAAGVAASCSPLLTSEESHPAPGLWTVQLFPHL